MGVFAPEFSLKKRRGKFVFRLPDCMTIRSKTVVSIGVSTVCTPTN